MNNEERIIERTFLAIAQRPSEDTIKLVADFFLKYLSDNNHSQVSTIQDIFVSIQPTLEYLIIMHSLKFIRLEIEGGISIVLHASYEVPYGKENISLPILEISSKDMLNDKIITAIGIDSEKEIQESMLNPIHDLNKQEFVEITIERIQLGEHKIDSIGGKSHNGIIGKLQESNYPIDVHPDDERELLENIAIWKAEESFKAISLIINSQDNDFRIIFKEITEDTLSELCELLQTEEFSNTHLKTFGALLNDPFTLGKQWVSDQSNYVDYTIDNISHESVNQAIHVLLQKAGVDL